jgi:flagellar hook-length control protein FliK
VAVLPTPSGPQIRDAILAPAPATPASLRRALAVEQAALGVLPARPDAVQPHIVSAPADVQQNMLDTRRQEWVGKMVEHIEALRDAAPVRETRLSLAPEALGKVDVSIRHDGDRLHVHFTTETSAARQLIADAQPRLSELAEARGLKLGQTSFESGTTGQGANRDSRNNPASQPPLAPRRAHSDSAVGTADDERIA